MVDLVVDMVQASGTVMQPTTRHTFLENGIDPTVVLTSNALQGNTLDHMMSTVGASCNKKMAVTYVTGTHNSNVGNDTCQVRAKARKFKGDQPVYDLTSRLNSRFSLKQMSVLHTGQADSYPLGTKCYIFSQQIYLQFF